MKLSFLITTLIFTSLIGFGQKNYTITGSITNEENQPIKDVKVFLSTNNNLVKRSNAKGLFSYTV